MASEAINPGRTKLPGTPGHAGHSIAVGATAAFAPDAGSCVAIAESDDAIAAHVQSVATHADVLAAAIDPQRAVIARVGVGENAECLVPGSEDPDPGGSAGVVMSFDNRSALPGRPCRCLPGRLRCRGRECRPSGQHASLDPARALIPYVRWRYVVSSWCSDRAARSSRRSSRSPQRRAP